MIRRLRQFVTATPDGPATPSPIREEALAAQWACHHRGWWGRKRWGWLSVTNRAVLFNEGAMPFRVARLGQPLDMRIDVARIRSVRLLTRAETLRAAGWLWGRVLRIDTDDGATYQFAVGRPERWFGRLTDVLARARGDVPPKGSR